MKISFLGVYNFLGIESYELDPKHVNLVSGGNGQGKTSLIDSIYKGIYNECPRPMIVRNGAEQAMILVKLLDDNGQEIEIERTINAEDPSKDKIKVIKDGVAQKKPETLLKSLMGQYTFGFNPVSFLQLKDKEQTDILLGLLPIHVTPEMLKEWFKDDELFPDGVVPPVNTNLHGLQVMKDLANEKGGYWYEKRKVSNTEVETLKNETAALQAQLPNNYNADEWRAVNLMEFSKKIQEAMKNNQDREAATTYIDREGPDIIGIELKVKNTISEKTNEIESKVSVKTEQIQELEKRIVELKTEINNLRDQGQQFHKDIIEQMNDAIEDRKARTTRAKDFLESHPEIEVDPLNEEFQTIETMKGYIVLADRTDDLSKKLTEKTYEAAVYNRFVDVARSKPADLLRSVKLPVEGLGIDDTGKITIHGLPIKNLSTSEQVRISLDIARNTCGDLMLICVDRFESLDPEVQKMFFEQISEDDFQYFVTTISQKYDDNGKYLSELNVEVRD